MAYGCDPATAANEKRRMCRPSGRCIRHFSIWSVPTHLERHFGGNGIKDTAAPTTMPEKSQNSGRFSALNA